MISILTKIVDRNRPDLVQEAEGQLEGAHFNITYRDEGDFLTADASKHDAGTVNNYSNAVIIVGKKTI